MTNDEKVFLEQHKTRCKELKRGFYVACCVALLLAIVIGVVLAVLFNGQHLILSGLGSALTAVAVFSSFALIKHKTISRIVADSFFEIRTDQAQYYFKNRG